MQPDLLRARPFRLWQCCDQVLGRAADRGPVSAYHNRPLNESRNFDHGANQLVVVVLICQAQLLVHRFLGSPQGAPRMRINALAAARTNLVMPFSVA
jgi:hypothetical protein